MTTENSLYQNQVLEELDKIPVEFMPSLLKLVQAFREGVTLASAEDTFRQGWKEALAEEVYPISELWKDQEQEDA